MVLHREFCTYDLLTAVALKTIDYVMPVMQMLKIKTSCFFYSIFRIFIAFMEQKYSKHYDKV